MPFTSPARFDALSFSIFKRSMMQNDQLPLVDTIDDERFAQAFEEHEVDFGADDGENKGVKNEWHRRNAHKDLCHSMSILSRSGFSAILNPYPVRMRSIPPPKPAIKRHEFKCLSFYPPTHRLNPSARTRTHSPRS